MSVRRRPRVWNKYEAGVPADAVNIMRGTPWGNPFRIRDGLTREEVIEAYIRAMSVDIDFLMRVRVVLHGRDLVCCCAPRACHGDWLLRVANEER